MPSLLSLRDLVGGRGGSFRVEVPALDLEPGDALAIVGPSGSGKSTVLDILAGILRPTVPGRFHCTTEGGTLDLGALWHREDIEAVRAYRAGMIGYVLQTGGLVPFLSIAENVALPFWRDGAARPEAVTAVLAELGLADLSSRLPRRVSVGQRQRAAIARALVGNPPIVLADEPTAALDHDTANAVLGLLTRIARDRSAALVVVTHDVELAEQHGFDLLPCHSIGPGRSRLESREEGR